MSRIEDIGQFKDTYPFFIDGRVEWADMDSFGHVNHASYISYFERVRMHFLEIEGILEYKQQHHIGPILATIGCKYILPLDYPDRLLFGLSIGEVYKDKFQHKYGIYSKNRDSLAAMGEGYIVFTDYNTGDKVDIPATILSKINKYLG